MATLYFFLNSETRKFCDFCTTMKMRAPYHKKSEKGGGKMGLFLDTTVLMWRLWIFPPTRQTITKMDDFTQIGDEKVLHFLFVSHCKRWGGGWVCEVRVAQSPLKQNSFENLMKRKTTGDAWQIPEVIDVTKVQKGQRSELSSHRSLFGHLIWREERSHQKALWN